MLVLFYVVMFVGVIFGGFYLLMAILKRVNKSHDEKLEALQLKMKEKLLDRGFYSNKIYIR